MKTVTAPSGVQWTGKKTEQKIKTLNIYKLQIVVSSTWKDKQVNGLFLTCITSSELNQVTCAHRVNLRLRGVELFLFIRIICVWERITRSPNRQEPPHVVTDASLYLPADWQQWHFMVGRHSFWMFCLKLDLRPPPLRCLNMLVDLFFLSFTWHLMLDILTFYSVFLESISGKGWKWYAAHGLLIKGKQSFEIILDLSRS